MLDTIIKMVEELPEPYMVRAGLGGLAAYRPRTMAIICILLEYNRTTYRGMAARLIASHELAKKLNLFNGTPSKNTIWRAGCKIPDSYFKSVHLYIIKDLNLGSAIAGDATGLSISKFVRWIDHRLDIVRNSKEWLKLHSIIDVKSRVIIAYMVTESTVADIKGMYEMLEGLGNLGLDFKGMDFCLDAAYLSRQMYDIVTALGMMPFIDVKKNTTHNAKGSWPWRDMVDMYLNSKDKFDDHYHQRSIIEAVFGALKKMYGSSLRCRRRDKQEKELGIKIICYNIEVAARQQVRDGMLTRQSLEAIAA